VCLLRLAASAEVEVGADTFVPFQGRGLILVTHNFTLPQPLSSRESRETRDLPWREMAR
jgi:hypothetical protein